MVKNINNTHFQHRSLIIQTLCILFPCAWSLFEKWKRKIEPQSVKKRTRLKGRGYYLCSRRGWPFVIFANRSFNLCLSYSFVRSAQSSTWHSMSDSTHSLKCVYPLLSLCFLDFFVLQKKPTSSSHSVLKIKYKSVQRSCVFSPFYLMAFQRLKAFGHNFLRSK